MKINVRANKTIPILYAKLPCIVSKIPELTDLIQDMHTGIRLKTWDFHDLTSKTQHLLRNKTLYKKIQSEGFKKIQNILQNDIKLTDVFK